MITRHRNYKGLFLLIICILMVSLMVLSPLLASCAPAVTDEKGALPEEEAAPPAVVDTGVILQEGNNLPKTRFQPKQSRELADNRIGTVFDLVSPHTYGEPDEFIHGINEVGYKWFRLNLNYGTWDLVDWSKGEYSKHHIEPHQDKTITGLANNDIKMICILSFWDVESPGKEWQEGYSRFKTEDEIQRYLDFVQFVVHNLKDRIEYYEMWNEPDSLKGTQEYIEPADYIKLVKRTVPVIREEYPDAKIVVGGTMPQVEPESREYLLSILSSDIMPLVDGVSFHPMYGTSPEYEYWREYYYNYASLVQEIKDVASSHGFKGEYIAEEMCWLTAEEPNPERSPWLYSETVVAKYYARAIIIHLGLNVTTILGDGSAVDSPKMIVIQNLCTIMAGAEPVSLPIEIQSEATNIRSYSFSLPNGDGLLALWTDGVAVDDDPGVNSTVILPGLSAQKVIGIDVLNGFEQEMITSVEDGNLVIRDLLVKDYPIILSLTP